jgi:mitochondrial import receptor subunit TOM70
MNVLPLVNKSLALFQWKKDGATAEQFCLEALQIDPLCEAAFATLGQIYLAQQQFDKALAKFRELTQISTNAPQLSLTFYHIYVSPVWIFTALGFIYSSLLVYRGSSQIFG